MRIKFRLPLLRKLPTTLGAIVPTKENKMSIKPKMKINVMDGVNPDDLTGGYFERIGVKTLPVTSQVVQETLAYLEAMFPSFIAVDLIPQEGPNRTSFPATLRFTTQEGGVAVGWGVAEVCFMPDVGAIEIGKVVKSAVPLVPFRDWVKAQAPKAFDSNKPMYAVGERLPGWDNFPVANTTAFALVAQTDGAELTKGQVLTIDGKQYTVGTWDHLMGRMEYLWVKA